MIAVVQHLFFFISFLDLWHKIVAPSETVAVKIGLWAGRNEGVEYSVHCASFVWSVIVLRRPYFAATMSFCLHSSGQLSVFTFLQNGIILQLFLLWQAHCRLATLRMAQQIPFVSAALHGPRLLPSTCPNEVNDSVRPPWPHRVQSNCNQIKVNPCGPPVRYAVFLFRL